MQAVLHRRRRVWRWLRGYAEKLESRLSQTEKRTNNKLNPHIYGVESRNWSQATWVRGECLHHKMAWNWKWNWNWLETHSQMKPISIKFKTKQELVHSYWWWTNFNRYTVAYLQIISKSNIFNHFKIILQIKNELYKKKSKSALWYNKKWPMIMIQIKKKVTKEKKLQLKS